MPPKIRVTREEILDAACALARTQGADAVNARAVAKKLNCSTQPVFSNFESMAALRQALIDRSFAEYGRYMASVTRDSAYPPYKAGGMAYIGWARKEKELFKLLFMRPRTDESANEQALFEDMATKVSDLTGLNREEARLFHLEIHHRNMHHEAA